MKKVIKINANVVWKTCQGPSGRWVGECQALGLSIEGDTLDEVFGLVDESTGLLFADLIDDNEFDRFLRDKGWTRQDGFDGSDIDAEIDLPFQLVIEGGKRGEVRRAC